MSLVGYDVSSGESSDEETKMVTQASASSVHEEWKNLSPTSNAIQMKLSSVLPKPKTSNPSILQLPLDEPTASSGEGLNLSSMLPKPKMARTSPGIEDNSLQDEPSSSSGKLMLSKLLPKPRENNATASVINVTAKRGLVKITAPELPTLNSDDSDDEPEVEKQKRRKLRAGPSEGKPKSGLFAKLPAPMNSGGVTKGTGRTFLPYVFSKPKRESGSKSMKVNSKDTSIPEPSSANLSIAEIRRRSAQAAAKIISEQAAAKSTNENEDSDDGEDDTSGGFFSYVEKAPEPDISEIEDLSETSVEKQTIVLDYAPVIERPEQPYYEENIMYVPPPPPSAPELPVTEEDPMVAIRRLQGKKHRNEEINFIDIRADDALEGNKELLLKSISEEKNMNRTSHSKRKNIGMPSGQQKRKHQLSYLVHQAKARELELKNTWAQNRATKQQTQMKYGF